MVDYVMSSDAYETFEDFKKKEIQIVEVNESSESSSCEDNTSTSPRKQIYKKNIMLIGAEKVGKANLIAALFPKQACADTFQTFTQKRKLSTCTGKSLDFIQKTIPGSNSAFDQTLHIWIHNLSCQSFQSLVESKLGLSRRCGYAPQLCQCSV